MTEQQQHRAFIPPVADGAPRPLWSVMIPTHDCAGYLRETLTSVLMQAPGPEVMQIEVVDDYSTKDDPEAVVQELGKGRVTFFRQLQNVGQLANFETCLLRARGQLVHLLHGDDAVKDGFYRSLQCAFTEHPEIGAAFCRHIFMDERGQRQEISPLEQDEPGILENWVERIAEAQRIQTPSIVVRREVYERIGAFDHRLSWCEDWEMWVRLANQYPVYYEPEPLAVYRRHLASNSGSHIHTGENIRDIRRAIDIYRSYLPNDLFVRVSPKAKRYYALYAITTSRELAANGDRSGAFAQLREAFRCSISPSVIGATVGLVAWYLCSGMKRRLAWTRQATT